MFVSICLKSGGDEKLTEAYRRSFHDHFCGVFRIEEFPFEGDDVDQFFRTEYIESATADWGVFNA